jgi:Fe-S oxidoreductase
VHLRPFLDLANPDDVRKMRLLAEDLYREVFEVGGSTGGENACGLSRTPFIRRQFGEIYEVVRQVKQIFDPNGIFNPGKIVGTDSDGAERYLRPVIAEPSEPAAAPAQPEAAPEMRDLVELQLNWDPSVVAAAAATCNGCGECRTQSPGMRMCPIFRFAPAEESSPRAKANLLRSVLTGRLELSALTSDAFKTIVDLCVHCHMCRLECPAAVDIPKLMREAKGAYVAANGLRVGDWLMMRLDLLGAMASLVSWPANWAIGNRQMRWLLEKTLGIAQGRKLPRVAARSFLRRSIRRRLTRPSRRSGQKVLYFVDVYANYFDPQLGEALVAVLEHNGVDVYVHPAQQQAGMAAIGSGALDYARRLAQRNTSILAEAVRQGYHVVATEPAAALCLTREYPQLLDDDDARLVADNTSEACSYLWKMHTLGKLQLDLRPINTALAYHMPCHLKALRVGSPGKNLLCLIPGLQVQAIEEGCSGMAGTFGLQRRNYRASLRAGRGMIYRLRDPGILAGTTECSTCKMQMEQGTSKPTLHPIKILALAYGLMPEIAGLLAAPCHELIVT